MSHHQRSFLFFLLCLVSLPLIPGSWCYSQERPDSLWYFYAAILHPKTPSDLPDGLAYYFKKKQECLSKHDSLGLLDSWRMIAIAQYKIGDIYDSEESVVAALRLIDALRQKDTLIDARIGLYNQLGKIYRSSYNYTAALNAYEDALQIAGKPADSMVLLNNMANIYKDRHNYRQALDQYILIQQKNLDQTDSLHRSLVLDNMGYVLAKLHEPAALDTLKKALAIRKKQHDLTGTYASYKNLSQYYYDRHERDTARTFARLAYETAQHINSSTYRYDALELLMRLKEDLQVLEFKSLTDSLAKAKQLAANKNAFVKYNLDAERQKTAAQELQKEREMRTKQLYQVSTIFILLLLVLSYFFFRYRYKKGKQEEMYRTESRISKKVHDELANDIFNVMAFAESKKLDTATDKEHLLSNLDRLYGKSRDISRAHARIDTGSNFPESLRDLLSNYATNTVNVLIKGLQEVSWEQLDEFKKIACYRVLQELMTNMKKHSRATLVLVEFKQEMHKISISYKDNGVGIAPDAPQRAGGLQNAENRIAANKGTFTFENRATKGFHCAFSFPV